MLNLDLKNSSILPALELGETPLFGILEPMKKLLSLAFIASFGFLLYGLFGTSISQESLRSLTGISIISFSLYLFFWHFLLFFEKKLKEAPPQTGLEQAILRSEEANLGDLLSFELARAVKKSLGENNTSFLLNSLINDNPEVFSFLFSRLLLNAQEFQKGLKNSIKEQAEKNDPENPVKNFESAFLEGLKIAQKRGHQRILMEDMIVALAKFDPFFKQTLVEAGLKTQDLENLTWWRESLIKIIKRNEKFWDTKNLARKGALGREWAAAYTVTLDRFSIDWTKIARLKGFEEIIGHQKELERIERTLSGIGNNNVLMVGEPGSGRGAILQALAQKILFGESSASLNYKRVVELNVSAVQNNFKNQAEAISALDKIFKEVIAADNIILVINEFHNFVAGEKSLPGTLDISKILLDYLKNTKFRLLGVTTFSGFHQFIEANSSISSALEKVEIGELSQEETILLLETFVPRLERKYKRFVSYPALREIVNLTGRYLPSLPFPKKATDLLEELMVFLSNTKEKILLPKHVAYLISEKTEIPVGDLSANEKTLLLNLETLLHERVIGQEEAISEVSSSLRRARADISIRKGPMGAFLFLGPSGVGKTETAKALAEIYFGTEKRIIRLDLSEFQNPEDFKRLIGTNETPSFFLTALKEMPFSLVLLDELEKAHPNVLNLFLQVLDEGSLTDGLGRKVSFTNTIIIATSNAGYLLILEALAKNQEVSEIKEKLLNSLFEKGVFRPEFVNRFDGAIIFKSLTKENLLKIAGLLLKKLKKNLDEKGIEFLITDEIKDKIVELGYDPIFGARQMRRVIQDKVENVLAQALLQGTIKGGDRVQINLPDFVLKINP